MQSNTPKLQQMKANWKYEVVQLESSYDFDPC